MVSEIVVARRGSRRPRKTPGKPTCRSYGVRHGGLDLSRPSLDKAPSSVGQSGGVRKTEVVEARHGRAAPAGSQRRSPLVAAESTTGEATRVEAVSDLTADAGSTPATSTLRDGWCTITDWKDDPWCPACDETVPEELLDRVREDMHHPDRACVYCDMLFGELSE